MNRSRIADPDLARQVDEGELAWYRHITPITEHYCGQVAQRDYRGKRVAYWGHVTYETISMALALQRSGAAVAVGACNVDSTDDVAAAYMASKGISVYGWRGMSRADYLENLSLVRAFEAEYLCDMGGELSVAYLDKQPPVVGALEATTSGLHLLRRHELPFPVYDWNGIPLKDGLHNRFHVGDAVWPVFSHVTGLGLYGRRVLVIGCGPVGKGIAERARALGALVYVADLDPLRLLEARHLGCETVTVEEGLARCRIVVTATGVEGVLREEHLRHARPGAVFFNAGHSNREIDIDWLYAQPHRRMRAHIEQFDVDGVPIYVLAKGSLLNLAAAGGLDGHGLFDLYIAVMLAGIAWMMDGISAEVRPGLQPYPAHLEREIAALAVRLQQEG
ncbi:MAG: adenosylhomocysteinase [Anaerolineae bacterium]|nr:adenosylhomocysteinase [Anaerolineae bacterium]